VELEEVLREESESSSLATPLELLPLLSNEEEEGRVTIKSKSVEKLKEKLDKQKN
jgi:hypothetical protein